MQAVQRIEREKRMDGGKKEEADDPHTSAAKQKRPLRVRSILRILGRPMEGAERYPPRSNAALADCFAMTPSAYNDTPVRSFERSSEG